MFYAMDFQSALFVGPPPRGSRVPPGPPASARWPPTRGNFGAHPLNIIIAMICVVIIIIIINNTIINIIHFVIKHTIVVVIIIIIMIIFIITINYSFPCTAAMVAGDRLELRKSNPVDETG